MEELRALLLAPGLVLLDEGEGGTFGGVWRRGSEGVRCMAGDKRDGRKRDEVKRRC
jgi:hypothetical protein